MQKYRLSNWFSENWLPLIQLFELAYFFKVWEWSEPILVLQPATTCFQKLYDPDLSVSTRADLFSEAVRPGVTLFQKLYRSGPLVLRSCTTPDRLSDLFSENGRAGQTCFQKLHDTDWSVSTRTDLFSEAVLPGATWFQKLYRSGPLVLRSCTTQTDFQS